jgi:uncharacterized protein (DUF58 family)
MLSPAELSRLGGLELIARAVVEGAVAGGHRSPFHGYSAEFSQYRSYRPGDDLKYVDWKLFARTDRVYTKQFRETTNAPVIIALDTSASMRFGAGVGKARYAQMLAAAIAFLVSRQGDAVGLLACADRPQVLVPPRSGVLQLTRIFAALERLAFTGRADLAAALRRGNELLRSRGLLMVISDLYDVDDGVLRELRRSVQGGHDVSVFHVVAPDERVLPAEAGIELEDLETGDSLPVSPAMAPEFRKRFDAFLDRSRETLVRDGIDYSLIATDQAVSAVLRRYLFRRSA